MAIILIIFGITLIIVNIKAINKKENSFGNMLKYKKEDISEVQIEIGQIRQDVAESLTEMQQEILELKNLIKEKKELQEEAEIEDNEPKEENSFNKKSKIIELIKEGYSEDEICNKLSLGKGEVLLVKNLFK